MEGESTSQILTVSPPACKRIKLASSSQVQEQAELIECVGDGYSKTSNQGAGSQSLSDTVQTEDGARSVSSEEGYYLLNFKSILSVVLTSSPERHVIADDAKSIVEGFMGLNRMFL